MVAGCGMGLVTLFELEFPAVTNAAVWYDFADSATLWQDKIRTTKVYKHLDPIRYVDNKGSIGTSADAFPPVAGGVPSAIWNIEGSFTVNNVPIGQINRDSAGWNNLNGQFSAIPTDTSLTRLILYRTNPGTPSTSSSQISVVDDLVTYPGSDKKFRAGFGLNSVSNIIRTIDVWDDGRLLCDYVETSTTQTDYYQLFRFSGTPDFTSSTINDPNRWKTNRFYAFGSFPSGTPNFTVALAVIWTKILSAAEKTYLQLYLLSKYNVTIS